MSDALLATTVFIDLYAGRPEAARLVFDLTVRFDRLLHGPLTVFELYFREMHPDELARHQAVLANTVEIPFGSAAARIMAGWLTGQPRSGRRRLLGDAIIAATAASQDATITTRNPRDFTRFYANVQAY